MIAIEPFTAQRRVHDGNGYDWQRCRAIGVTTNMAGDPLYLVEVFENGESWLSTADTLRRPAPTA